MHGLNASWQREVKSCLVVIGLSLTICTKTTDTLTLPIKTEDAVELLEFCID